MKPTKYVLLTAAIVLMLIGLYVSTTVFENTLVSAEDSMVRFTVADFIWMFALPLCAIVHGIVSRITLKQTLVPHIIWFSAVWLGWACIRSEHLFSVPGLLWPAITTVLSLISSLLTRCFQKKQ